MSRSRRLAGALLVPLLAAACVADRPAPTDPGETPGTSSAPTLGSTGTDAPGTGAAAVLGRPTDASITVNVVAAVDADVWCEYGTASGAYTQRTASQRAVAGEPIETLISGLLANTRYHYRMHIGDTAGPEGTFVTQRSAGSTYVFDVQGDSHPERAGKQWDAGLYETALQDIAADSPDFLVMMGDDFSVDTLRQVDQASVDAVYLRQREWLTQVGSPIFLVNGNHEQAALANLDGTADNVAVWAQAARNAYFPLPAPVQFYSCDAVPVEHIGLLRDYYAFTWGDALFAVIDPYWHSPGVVDNAFGEGQGKTGSGGKGKQDPWSVTLGETQYRWLEETLGESTARYKFVFAHHVNGTGRGGVESAGSGEWGDAAHLAANRTGWDRTIQQLMADTGVTIFFQGHDHVFTRQELDGVVYQTAPSPADPNDTMGQAGAYKEGTVLPGSGHLRVTVTPDGVTVAFVRVGLNVPSEVVYTYTLP